MSKQLDKILCKIYRSSRRAEMYLYLNHEDDLGIVPETLLARFGQPELVMSMALSSDQKLARVDSAAVIKALTEQGFYLQMPPGAEQYMAEISQQNEKIPRS